MDKNFQLTGNSKLSWNNFIFSNRLCFRVFRHIAFWLAFYFWFIVLSDIWIIKYADYIPSLYTRLPLYILSTYLTLYFLVPRYVLTKKYGMLFFAATILSVLYPLISIGLLWIDSKSDYAKLNSFLLLKIALWDGWGLTMAINGFASIIKLIKNWHLEHLENKHLQLQKTDQELQLLKCQLNSRFLVDALQCIHHHVRHQSPQSSELIMKLSDLLSYTLYESDGKSVLLTKEIELIKGYLSLAKECFGRINIRVTQQGEMDKKTISPLVLLPLFESLFENDAVTFSNDSDILLDFRLQGLLLLVSLKLRNLKSFRLEAFKNNLYLKNVQQRLQSCYLGKHQLEIIEDHQDCALHLELNLCSY